MYNDRLHRWQASDQRVVATEFAFANINQAFVQAMEKVFELHLSAASTLF